MDFWRRAPNPWSQDVLLGVSWDLMWAAAAVGLAFIVAHVVWTKVRAASQEGGPVSEAAGTAPGLAARLLRHSLTSRLFHWVMAASMLVLLVTAFFPVLGLQFDWITWHWIAGVVLLGTIVFHVVHSTVARNWKTIWIDRAEMRSGIDELKHFVTGKGQPPAKTGKYPTANKAFHHAAVVVGVAAIVTGVLMMFRIETVFWAPNPYILGDGMWGVVYVVHGLSGVALITMTAAHIYFAVRPDKWWLTRSMIKGWVTREEFLAHHDPEQWSPEEAEGEAGVPTGTAADPAVVA